MKIYLNWKKDDKLQYETNCPFGCNNQKAVNHAFLPSYTGSSPLICERQCLYMLLVIISGIWEKILTGWINAYHSRAYGYQGRDRIRSNPWLPYNALPMSCLPPRRHETKPMINDRLTSIHQLAVGSGFALICATSPTGSTRRRIRSPADEKRKNWAGWDLLPQRVRSEDLRSSPRFHVITH